MAVIQGWGVCDPWQNEEAHPGWHRRMFATLQPWKYINHQFDSPWGTRGRLMRLVFAMQQDVHSASALTEIPAGQWHMIGNEGEHGDQGSDVAPDVAARFSRYWVEQRGPNVIAPGFGIFWQQGWDWADAYMKAGGFIGKVMQVSCYAGHGQDLEGQLGNLDKWKAKWNIRANVVLREFNAWANVPDAPREQVVRGVRKALADGRIQQAYMFPTYYGVAWTTGCLLNADGSLRYWGKKWIEIGQA